MKAHVCRYLTTYACHSWGQSCPCIFPCFGARFDRQETKSKKENKAFYVQLGFMYMHFWEICDSNKPFCFIIPTSLFNNPLFEWGGLSEYFSLMLPSNFEPTTIRQITLGLRPVIVWAQEYPYIYWCYRLYHQSFRKMTCPAFMQYHVSVCCYSLFLKYGNRCGLVLNKMNYLQTYKDEILDCLFSPRNKVSEWGTPHPKLLQWMI